MYCRTCGSQLGNGQIICLNCHNREHRLDTPRKNKKTRIIIGAICAVLIISSGYYFIGINSYDVSEMLTLVTNVGQSDNAEPVKQRESVIDPEPVVERGPITEPVVESNTEPEPVVERGPITEQEPVVESNTEPEPVVERGSPIVDDDDDKVVDNTRDNEATKPITLHLDPTSKTTYNKGETISITGEIKPITDNISIHMTIKREDGSIVTDTQTSTNDDGRYALEIISGGPTWSSDGKYTITVQYEENQKTTTFNYNNESKEKPKPVNQQEEEPNCSSNEEIKTVGGKRVCVPVDNNDNNDQASVSLVVRTDQDRYVIGDSIVVSGTVTNIAAGSTIPIEIRILNSNNESAAYSKESHDDAGNFSKSFTVTGSKFAANGTYQAIAKYDMNYTSIVKFEFGEGSSEPNCSSNEEIKTVNGERVCVPIDNNDNNNQISENFIVRTDQDRYVVSNSIVVSGTVTNIAAGSAVPITIRILNSDNDPAAFAEVNHDDAGNFTKLFIATGPAFAVNGTYQVITKYGANDTSIIRFEFSNDSSEPSPNPVVEQSEEPNCSAGEQIQTVNGERVCVPVDNNNDNNNQTSVSLVVRTDQDRYVIDDNIIVNGTVTNIAANSTIPIIIEILNSDNASAALAEVNHDDVGKFSKSFTATESEFAVNGTYQVIAKYDMNYTSIVRFEFGNSTSELSP